METIRRLFNTYFPFARGIYLSRFWAYRHRSFIWAMSHVILLLTTIYLWQAIFNHSEHTVINGFTVEAMIIYVMVSKITEALVFANVEHFIANDVRNGEIVSSLIKPISYRMSIVFKSIGQMFGSVTIFLPVYVVMFVVLNTAMDLKFQVDVLQVLCYVVVITLGYGMNLVFSMIFATLILKTTGHKGIYETKQTIILLLSGALIPLEFYPEALRAVVDIMPFQYMRYVPNMILIHGIEMTTFLRVILNQSMWLIVFVFIQQWLWQKMKKEIQIVGG